jgi:hypothetical protein
VRLPGVEVGGGRGRVPCFPLFITIGGLHG